MPTDNQVNHDAKNNDGSIMKLLKSVKLFILNIFATSKDNGESWFDTLKTLTWALLVAFAIRSFLFEPFYIPSGSMYPTLMVGDYMFVNKMSYGYSRYSFPFAAIPFDDRILSSQPEQGDVAVFRHPDKTEIDFVKRIIGMPNDKIQVISGILHINDVAVKRKRIEDYLYNPEFPNAKTIRQYRETLPNGVVHNILETSGDNGYYDNTRQFIVPDGHYFVMGDNRDNSNDSRGDVRFVPVANFIGKASFFFYSVDGTVSLFNPLTWPSAIRFSRFFNGIE